jgi:hypothetical protein
VGQSCAIVERLSPWLFDSHSPTKSRGTNRCFGDNLFEGSNGERDSDRIATILNVSPETFRILGLFGLSRLISGRPCNVILRIRHALFRFPQ